MAEGTASNGTKTPVSGRWSRKGLSRLRSRLHRRALPVSGSPGLRSACDELVHGFRCAAGHGMGDSRPGIRGPSQHRGQLGAGVAGARVREGKQGERGAPGGRVGDGEAPADARRGAVRGHTYRCVAAASAFHGYGRKPLRRGHSGLCAWERARFRNPNLDSWPVQAWRRLGPLYRKARLHDGQRSREALPGGAGQPE